MNEAHPYWGRQSASFSLPMAMFISSKNGLADTARVTFDQIAGRPRAQARCYTKLTIAYPERASSPGNETRPQVGLALTPVCVSLQQCSLRPTSACEPAFGFKSPLSKCSFLCESCPAQPAFPGALLPTRCPALPTALGGILLLPDQHPHPFSGISSLTLLRSSLPHPPFRCRTAKQGPRRARGWEWAPAGPSRLSPLGI